MKQNVKSLLDSHFHKANSGGCVCFVFLCLLRCVGVLDGLDGLCVLSVFCMVCVVWCVCTVVLVACARWCVW